MSKILLLFVFFGGLALTFLTGRLIGHIIGLDKYFSYNISPKTPLSAKTKRNKRKGMEVKKDLPVNILGKGNEYAKNDQNIRIS
jgi:hypothetical protein